MAGFAPPPLEPAQNQSGAATRAAHLSDPADHARKGLSERDLLEAETLERVKRSDSNFPIDFLSLYQELTRNAQFLC
jgi:hypothetical protein